MQHINDFKAKLDKALNEKNCATDLLKKAEEKTGVDKIYLVAGLAAFIALYLIVGYGAQFLANFIGFIYPAYCSIKAIETKEKDDDTKWLTYWVVYAAFSLVEFFTDIFLWWIPLYAFLKCIFLIYCFYPAPWNGSIFIYSTFLRPLALKHQSKVDDLLDQAANTAGDIKEFAEEAHSAYQRANKMD